MKDSTKKTITRWFWFLLITPIVLVLVLIGIVWAFAEIPTLEELENPDNKLATQVIAEEGEILTTYHIENRTFVPYDELAPSLVQAAVATEDVRFYKHSGIDFTSLGRVLFKTLLSRNSSQGGGSTITQQLAKTMYPRREGVGKIGMVWIKFREWITAIKLERNYTKEEIVDMYLNAVFYGSNSYGIQSAAAQFFGKRPSELLTEESAVLVGMVNKPTRYNPAINPDKALQRRNTVLDRMTTSGYLTKAERDSLQQLPIVLTTRKGDRTTGTGPYFRDMLRRTMSASKPKRSSYFFAEDFRVDSLQWADDPLYGWLHKNHKADGSEYDLDRDGLRIYTTINIRMQKYAEEAVAEHLGKDLQIAFDKELKGRKTYPFDPETDKATMENLMAAARKRSDRTRNMKASGHSDAEIAASFSEPVKMRVFTWEEPGYRDTVLTPDDSIRYYKHFLQAGFMAIEPGTGHVKAYVGGPDYRYFKYDCVRQGKRQVGSTIKPFLYTLAMESGLNPCHEVLNVRQVFQELGPDDLPYSPEDAHADGSVVNLRWGLAQSSNSVSAYLMKMFGPVSMVDMMRKMGIGCYLDPVVSLCVGSAEIPVYQMVTAYNTFPSGGFYTNPIFVTRIEDSDGNILGQFSDRGHQALSPLATNEMISMMQEVVNTGTGIRLRLKYGLKNEIAGKTGTTNKNSDGWFIGYTPRITAGAWVGAEDPVVHIRNNRIGQGANMALPIWALWMKKVLADPTLGISADDVFPEDVHKNFCSSSSASSPEDGTAAGQESTAEDYFFE